MSFGFRRAVAAFLVLLFCVGLGAQTVTAPVLGGITGGGSVELGAQVTLTVLANSPTSGLVYQWRKGDTDIPTARSPSYVIPAVTAEDAGTYTVTVTNAAGSSVSSRALTVRAGATPLIVTPPADRTVQAGQSATFSYVATGSFPRTHQWRKNGSEIPGALGSSYTLAAVTQNDAGTYSVVVTNSFGSATSPAGSLTINAATPVVISPIGFANPTITQGEAMTISVSHSGSSPFIYQWRKNGVNIPGATGSSYIVPAATFADAGSYSVVVTNFLGAVTSNDAVATVRPATSLVLVAAPQPRTVFQGEFVNFSVSVSGSSPIRFQWYKDAQPIPDATSSFYSANPAKVADTGDYTVTATNILGAITTPPARLVVNAPALPVLVSQPADASVTAGASISFQATATGAPPLSYRWYFNGSPVGGGSSTHNVEATLDRSGVYYVVVTNPAGSVTSRAAILTVQPATVPEPVSLGSVMTRHGQFFQLNLGYVTNAQSYQWYKDGQPIPGNFGQYTVLSANSSDAGEYFVVVTTATGVRTSETARVLVSQPDIPPLGGWVAAERGGNVAYFAFANPARVERFDLAADTWLAPILLSRAPTAITIGPDALYLGLGPSVVRSNLDSTGSVVLSSFESDVAGLALVNGHLVVSQLAYVEKKLTVLRVSDGARLDAINFAYSWGASMAAAPGLRRVFSVAYVSPRDVVYYTVAADGKLSSRFESPYHGDFPEGDRLYVSSDESRVIDDGGMAYRTADLLYAGSLGGRIDDLAFFNTGMVALRSGTITVYDSSFAETGQLETGMLAARIFVQGDSVFAFAHPAPGAAITRTTIALSRAVLRPAAVPVAAAGLAYTPDSSFVDRDGLVYLYSRIHRQIFRWSPVEQRYLPPISLGGTPNFVTYSAANHRIYLGYTDARILQIKLDAGLLSPEAFARAPVKILGMVAVNEFVVVSDAAKSSLLAFAPDGRLVSRRELSNTSREFAWNPALRRLYQFQDNSSPNDLLYTEMAADGSFGAQRDSPAHGGIDTIYPIRISPDGGSVLLGSGQFFDAQTLAVTNALPNRVEDAVWLSTGLITARTTAAGFELQRWGGPNYALDRQAAYSGRLSRIHALPNGRLIVVHLPASGIPSFSLLDSELLDPSDSVSSLRFVTQPQSRAVSPSGATMLSMTVRGSVGLPSYGWTHNGRVLAGKTGASLILQNLQPFDVGLYAGSVTGENGTSVSAPAIIGIATSAKVTGTGTEVGPNIIHANGNVYDQVLLEGVAAAVTADSGQVLRISYVDLTDDIVQVEFSGAGTLTLVLNVASGPAGPVNYNQAVNYVKGHAGIVLTDANETTHLSVFSVGRANAVNQSLFKPETAYDGVADLAFIAITSTDGKFGGLRAANANFFNASGVTGIYAPEVEFTGPVLIGDVSAFDTATPMLVFGRAADARIAGGDLSQVNGRSVVVNGLAELKFVAGATSHNTPIPAKSNLARFTRQGVDVTSNILITH